ncbi:related to Pfs domain protein [Ramularia collo-cygni]|uniref:Related to Pfs domain protein n=1 Tax=Ramularia collo-cygni TaxID=112498 RepID=A0A2D3VF09_9PEZI|nr:related to Pfs domain protein [Ramularia collo-cygni]CZT20349.1 related to Pfs domain protein [Ramularia collo-cygni]
MGCLPDSQMGTGPAASVAAEMGAMFPSLRFGLLVGVGGGVWSEDHDVRLGDVVVSRPDKDNNNGGVIQYDYGKAIQGGEFQETGILNLPPTILLSSLGKLRSTPAAKSQFFPYLKSFEAFDDDSPEFARRPTAKDRLFKPEFGHVKKEATCRNCDAEHEIYREERLNARSKVHYGTIASGNQVMKDAEKRDTIAEGRGILCFEMEAAGLMNQFPCLVVRGICDYCDSHKNKAWQPYAAAAAAAWAKELLRNVSPGELRGERTIQAQGL